MGPKDADGMANSVDPDQTGSTLFAQTCLSENLGSLWNEKSIISEKSNVHQGSS